MPGKALVVPGSADSAVDDVAGDAGEAVSLVAVGAAALVLAPVPAAGCDVDVTGAGFSAAGAAVAAGGLCAAELEEPGDIARAAPDPAAAPATAGARDDAVAAGRDRVTVARR